MNNNQNSFAMNVAELTKNTNNAISALSSLSDSLIGNTDTVTINLGDNTINIPSYNNIIDRVNTVENTVKSFVSGQGSVKLLDGTNRRIKVTTLPTIPQKIENIEEATNFYVDANWFFEDLMFPKLSVRFNLKDKIDDNSDRIKVLRVILNTNDNIINTVGDDYVDEKANYQKIRDNRGC